MVLNPRTMWMFLISLLLSVFTGSLTHSRPAYDHGSDFAYWSGLWGICAKSWFVCEEKNILVFFSFFNY